MPFLVEKPLATTVADAAAIVAAVSEAGIVAEVNYSNRWNPPFAAVRRAIDRGEIGEPVAIFARLDNAIGSPAERLGWAGRKTPGWFPMSHCLDLAWWLGGRRAVSVYAAGHRGLLAARGIDTFGGIHAIVTYEGGSTGSFESVWVLPDGMPSPVDLTFRLAGTRGAVTVDTHEQAVRLATAERTTFPGTLAWAPQRFQDFAAAVRGERTPGVPVIEGLETTRILVALHRSLASGSVESLPEA